MMKKIKNWIVDHWFWIVVGSILLIAIVTRFYKLGEIPRGMTWDEAAIAYNGFSVWTTRRDEWLQFLPISFQSFGDYKAPLAIYLNGFFTFLFGLNLFAVRLPFALSSLVAILGIIGVSWALAKLVSYKNAIAFSLISGALFTLSPWHIHFSRAGFESGMSLSFSLVGLFFLLLAMLQQTKSSLFKKIPTLLTNSYLLLLLSSGFLVASMYAYHSAKIVAPLLGLIVVVTFFSFWKKHLAQLIFVAVSCLILLLPMTFDSIYGPGATRFSQTSIFSAQGSASEKSVLFLSNFGSHFTPNFLLFGETTHLRHGTGEWGVLFPTTLAFLLLAIVLTSIDKVTNKSNRSDRLVFFCMLWIGIGIIPAALGAEQVPHSNRALLALPGFLGLASIGVLKTVKHIEESQLNKKIRGNHGEKNTVRDAVIGSIILLHGVFFFSFWNYYSTVFVANSSEAYQDGYLQAFEIVKQYERGENNYPQVEKIIFSDEYGQPYIYALVSRKTSPIYYRGGSLIKYEFKNVDIGDFQRKNTLIVASAQDTDLPLKQADHIIYGGNGEVRFHIYYLP